ncbi:helix-turn-helix domain-containing protein [Fodinibacter luteus]|uniref:Helix-turn-helix domain-containing protein n=1 Tax=Fodinibacter luteus TaxID=552064 RepID=A0ABP8KCR3_9MICO
MLRAVADGRAGATVSALAAALGGHPNTTRHHLRALLAAGLVEARADGRAARGRPAVRYVVTPRGRDAASGAATVDPATEEYLALATAFADRLAATGADPSEESRAVGRAWGAALAGRELLAEDPLPGPGAAEPRRRVLALLDRLGFSPRPVPAPDAGRLADARDVELRTCPLLDAATRHPEVVCQVHVGLVGGADAAYGGTGEGVRLAPFARPGACLLTLPSAR